MRAAVDSTPNPNADLATQKLIDELNSSTSLTCELLSQIRQFQKLNPYNLKVKKYRLSAELFVYGRTPRKGPQIQVRR